MKIFPATDWLEPDRFLSRPGYRPADVAIIGFILFLTLMILLRFRQIPHAPLFILVDWTMVFVLSAWARYPIPDAPAWIRIIRQFHPTLFIPILFGHLVEIIPAVTTADRDAMLIRWDHWLFGTDPSIFLQRFHLPLLTECLQYVYTAFYFIPLSVAVVLAVRRKYKDYDFYVFMTCYGFFLSYLGYFLVPAIGPRFTLNPFYQFELHGVWLYQPLADLINFLESINRDCFPSGHTMMTLVALHYAFRFERKTFWVLLPFGAGLAFATVYLRYHYGVDVLAAVLWYLFAVTTGPILYRLALRLVYVPLRNRGRVPARG
jgi:membrane-associated phospholipid phosphatase